MSTTISIVEDHLPTGEKLVALLNRSAAFRCLTCYASGEDALVGIPKETPDVALIDINLPGISGIECVRGLKMRCPNLKILMLTKYEESDLIFDSLRAGASGYLLKNLHRAELTQAIEQVQAGGAPMSMSIARKIVDHFQSDQKPGPTGLSPKEQEILALLAKGYLKKEIADELGISAHTVSTHVRHIYEKLHVRSRVEAAAKFFGRA